MRIRHIACITVLAALSLSTASAAGCQLQNIGTLPVDMQGLYPLVSMKINGAKARFELDSGSFYSFLWRGATVRYRLPVTPVLGDSYYVSGFGGSEKAYETTVRTFGFLGFAASHAKFLVLEGSGGTAGEPAGLIGENLLRVSDVEYDLANGVVRFFKPADCKGQPLAYWAVNTPYTSVKLQNMYVAQYELSATARIDGHRVTVWFDTGSPRSVLSLNAAKRIGITTHSPGVKFLGVGGGVEGGAVKIWVAPVKSFQLGGEKVEHAHLLMAHLSSESRSDYWTSGFPDMLLGEDFFLSHRIYVAYSQDRLYFTYNGGPLFNLNLPQVISGQAALPPASGAGSRPAAPGTAPSQPIVPADAAHSRRQGMAYAAMHRFEPALADLTRACALAPGDARNHYERGLVYAEDKQFASALEDYDAAIKLSPDDVEARLARVRLLRSHPDADPTSSTAVIKADLEAISRSSAPDADVRLTLGAMYGWLGDYQAGLTQINQWLSTHPLKGDQAYGLDHRCWLRARTDQDLGAALADCNHSLDVWYNMNTLASRGLVYLRLGRPRAAISDYDAALDISPAMATALYGRGLAELRLGRKTRAQKDLAAAKKSDSGIVKYFAQMGLSP
ncbi:MAG: tetratricopeptide repeat protein [Proteobacteria bacterium]|nr:tetratricopeptide repeat protein [Pseudomonadota bacterium]